MKRTRLESRVEVLKLARLLDVPEVRLAYLEAVPPADLRKFRERATDRLYDADGHALARVAAASRLLPAQVSATIGQRAFGPLLCARIAGRLDPGRGVEMASRLPPDFLADVAVELDPRRAIDVIVRIPTVQIVEVAGELIRRGEYVAMGRFVGHLSDESITAALAVIDDESLLRICFVLEAKQRLSHVAGLLPDERVAGLIGAAADADLWPEALDLLSNLPDARRGRFADAAAEQSDEVLTSLVQTAQREELWDLLLPIARVMSEDSRRRFAALPALHEPEVLDEIVRVAERDGLRDDLEPLIEFLPGKARRRVERAIATQR
jgi:hypothetical protein